MLKDFKVFQFIYTVMRHLRSFNEGIQERIEKSIDWKVIEYIRDVCTKYEDMGGSIIISCFGVYDRGSACLYIYDTQDLDEPYSNGFDGIENYFLSDSTRRYCVTIFDESGNRMEKDIKVVIKLAKLRFPSVEIVSNRYIKR